jgi:transcriptional regulator with XRE-family HTH domain
MPEGADWVERLRAWRVATGLTREVLGQRAGVSAESIKAYETGRRRPPREVLIALLNELSVEVLDRDTILAGAGFAPDYRTTGRDRPDPEHTFEEALAELSRCEWPSMITNEAMDVVAANLPAQRVWGVDLATEFNTPVERNILAQMSNPRIADQIANWDETMRTLVPLVKGSYGDQSGDPAASTYFSAVMAHFMGGEPRYVQAATRIWLEAEPRILKWRFDYRLHWQHPTCGLLEFQVVVNPVNRQDHITINDWLPLDGQTWDSVRALCAD